MAVWQQEMNASSLLLSHVAQHLQVCHRRSALDAHLSCHVGYAVDRAIPYDVFYVDVVAYEHVAVVVNVYDADQSVALLSEVIEER